MKTSAPSDVSTKQSSAALAQPPAAGTRLATGTLSSSRQNLHPEQPRATRGGSAASSVKDVKESETASARRTKAGITTQPKTALRKPVTGAAKALPNTKAPTVPQTTSAAAKRTTSTQNGSTVRAPLRTASRPPTTATRRAVTSATASQSTLSSDVGPAADSEALALAAQAHYEAVLRAKEEAVSALRHAVLEAKRWCKADAAIVDILRTLGEAYRCIRTLKGKRAVWLLRSAPDDTKASTLQFAFPSVPDNADSSAEVIEPGEAQTALAAYKVLDHRIRSSTPIKALIGRAYHDMSLYFEAERYFEAAHRMDPTMTASMDIYSLVLFHLNREVALSALAQHLMLLDAKSPVAHVASGNAFSLQREHGFALKCFRRAILVAPTNAYYYTLAGYEALELGNREEARNYFRSGIRCERRHWNAWSGLGQICLLDGNPLYAEFHYKTAASINGQNAVLFDLLGWVSGFRACVLCMDR